MELGEERQIRIPATAEFVKRGDEVSGGLFGVFPREMTPLFRRKRLERSCLGRFLVVLPRYGLRRAAASRERTSRLVPARPRIP